MDELTKQLNLVTHVLDQSAAEHRDEQEQAKSDADQKLAASFGEAASKIGGIMKRIDRRIQLMQDAVEWIREQGAISYEQRDLICGRIGNIVIRIFPFGSEPGDETAWAGVFREGEGARNARACYTLEELQETVEALCDGNGDQE